MPVRNQTPTTSAAISSTQGHRNLADRDPFVPVNTLSHDTTATVTVVLGAAIPDTFHHFPYFRISAFVYNKFSLSLGTQVGHVIGFQIALLEDVFHVIVCLCDGVRDLFFHHECNVFESFLFFLCTSVPENNGH